MDDKWIPGCRFDMSFESMLRGSSSGIENEKKRKGGSSTSIVAIH